MKAAILGAIILAVPTLAAMALSERTVTALAADPARHSCAIENRSAGDIRVSFAPTTGAPSASFKVPPMGILNCGAGVATYRVRVTSAPGAQYTVTE